MNFACVYRVETRGLAAVKALGVPSKQAGPQPDLIHWNQARFAAVCGLARWRINAPELQAKIQQQAPVIDAPLTEWLSHKPTFASLRRGAKLSFGNAGAYC